MRYLIQWCCLLSLLPAVGEVTAQEVQLSPADVYRDIPTRRSTSDSSESRGFRVETSQLATPGASLAERPLPVPETLSSSSLEFSRQQSQTVAEFEPPVSREVESGLEDGPAKVDLREFLPVPGQQKQQNCVAWAVGYASYSCQVCQQRQKNHPSQAYDIFSPSFIYNKLKGEHDDGLQVHDAINFLTEHGCATLQTMPLGTEQPGADSEREARVYRPWAHERAETLADIRDYLQHGYPVVLVIRNDKTFNRNQRLTQPFRWQKTRQQMNADFDEYGPHAICAVGYDDEQKAVLVMNSLGTDWKDSGFCWVHYDTLARIPSQRTDDVVAWCLEAHVVKIKEAAPANISMQHRLGKVRFQLLDDERLYNGPTRLSPPSWHVEDIACNDQTVFLLRQNHMVASLNNLVPVMLEEESPVWNHLVNGLPTDSKVTMVAATYKTPLHALTLNGELFEYRHIVRSWRRVQIPDAAESLVVDLRDHQSQGPLTITTQKGQIFTFTPDEGWASSEMP